MIKFNLLLQTVEVKKNLEKKLNEWFEDKDIMIQSEKKFNVNTDDIKFIIFEIKSEEDIKKLQNLK